MTDEAIFNDVSATIRGALERLKEQYPGNNHIASNALSDALQQLMAMPEPVIV
jgi:hypothetical protein